MFRPASLNGSGRGTSTSKQEYHADQRDLAFGTRSEDRD